ncbi:MAG: hypothetical protein MUD16_05525 [Desulfobacterales bacterium]|nr:hypothetical protein [Desulfobacterales bacterium]
MLRMVICGVVLLAAMVPGPEGHGKTVPHGLLGFVVGDVLENHRHKLREETAIPIRFSDSLREVETVPQPGYKTGLVTYGTCLQPPRIIRLKFKYADSSKEFYDKLLARFKQRFGKPDKRRGDPFGIVIVWKWSFVDENGNDISLVLQHNLKDEEEKKGNSVKLTMWNLMQAESRCVERKTAESAAAGRGEILGSGNAKEVDWDLFVPK